MFKNYLENDIPVAKPFRATALSNVFETAFSHLFDIVDGGTGSLPEQESICAT